MPRILLTGATGYIGGRLLPELVAAGYRVRCLARQPEYLRPRVPAGVDVFGGDVRDPVALASALAGVDVAYYLVHSMSRGHDFAREDRLAAETFAAAARAAGVTRIVYLGGLGHGAELSPHLASRQEVGRILRQSGTEVLEFRASIIIGSGSLSYEMIRALIHKLPVMVIPRWVKTLAQPIAIEDEIAYLVAAADVTTGGSVILEIGGADRVSYLDIMREYARRHGLVRFYLPVPLLTLRLSSLWLGLVTPLYARVGRALIESVRNETVVHDDRALRLIPLRPRGMAEAIARAEENEDRAFAATRWSDAVASGGASRSWAGVRFGTRIVDSRSVEVSADTRAAFAPIRRIGGRTGWYCGNALWRVRGALDRLAGGVGMRRGRRDPDQLLPGDTVDFWRVEAMEPDRMLRLVAEMRLPGRAWLQFDVQSITTGARITQTAIFDPVGLWGLVYWYMLYPVHHRVFEGMLRSIARATVGLQE
ncbi:SDR family oxidoreductase [bacterium]|nr:SDR family oxidoreductase [bacterium]